MQRRFAALVLGTIAFVTAACGSTNSEPLFGDDSSPAPGFLPMSGGLCARPSVLRSSTSPVDGCSASAHGGRARVVQVNVLGVATSLVDTGELSPEGGSLRENLATVDLGPLLYAEVATASVDGADAKTSAHAEVAKLRAEVLGVGIAADIIEADASAACSPRGVVTSGASTIANLRVNDTRIVITGEPNQTVEIGGVLRVIINEQLLWPDGIRVRALHVTALQAIPAADVILSSAEARIECNAPCDGRDGPPPGGSGGWSPGDGHGDGGDLPGGCPSGGCSGGTGNGSNANGSNANGSNGVGGGTAGEACDASHPCASGFVCNH